MYECVTELWLAGTLLKSPTGIRGLLYVCFVFLTYHYGYKPKKKSIRATMFSVLDCVVYTAFFNWLRNYLFKRGCLAQSVEHLAYNESVSGSSPLTPKARRCKIKSRSEACCTKPRTGYMRLCHTCYKEKGRFRSRPLGRLRTLDFDQLASIRFRSTNVDHFTNHLISSNLKNKYRKFEGKLSGHSGTGKHTRFRPWGESRAGFKSCCPYINKLIVYLWR